MAEADVLRLLLSLIVIIALILALAWVARRVGWLRGNAAQSMRVLGTQNLGGNRAYLALVQVDDARLVLGVTASQITLLHTLPNQPADNANPAHAASEGTASGPVVAQTAGSAFRDLLQSTQNRSP